MFLIEFYVACICCYYYIYYCCCFYLCHNYIIFGDHLCSLRPWAFVFLDLCFVALFFDNFLRFYFVEIFISISASFFRFE